MAINKNYLQLEFKSGLFFIYSGKEEQGYEKHVSSKDNVSYRKYFKDGVKGVLESVGIHEGKFGQQISMNIKDGDEVYYVPVDIYDQKGQVDTYAESLIKLLPSLEKGMEVLVRGYNFTPEDSKYPKIGISITANGEKLKSALTNAYYKNGELVAGDIPAIEWVEKLGKKKPSAVSIEAKDNYLLEKITEHTERLKWVSNGGSSTPTPQTPANGVPTATPQEAFEPATNTKQTPYDDLPFG